MRNVAACLVALTLLAWPAAAGLFDSGWDEARDKVNACTADVDKSPRLSSLNARLVRRNPTLVQLADESLPSETDAADVKVRAEMEGPCRSSMLAALGEHHPGLRPAYQLRYLQTDLVYVKLLQRRISFGNANRLLHESWIELDGRQQAYNRAQSDAERRAIGESLDRLARAAQASPPPAGTGRLTCRWIGPTLYCDPY